MFCRECAMNNLLSQRQEIKRLEREMEKGKDEEKDQEEREDEAARERAIKEFELVQMGLNVKSGANSTIVGREGGKVVVEEEQVQEGARKGVKRKFELDEEELLRIAKEERTKYKKELDDEKVCRYTPTNSFSADNADANSKLRKRQRNTSPPSGYHPKRPTQAQRQPQFTL
jgi:nitric oxide synthase-interacting protein